MHWYRSDEVCRFTIRTDNVIGTFVFDEMRNTDITKDRYDISFRQKGTEIYSTYRGISLLN